MHSDCNYTNFNYERVMNSLASLNKTTFNETYVVIDDLGLGEVNIKYTLGAILAQANSHAIHHYAIINYILDRLGITIEDDTFGFNPTTPKTETNLN